MIRLYSSRRDHRYADELEQSLSYRVMQCRDSLEQILTLLYQASSCWAVCQPSWAQCPMIMSIHSILSPCTRTVLQTSVEQQDKVLHHSPLSIRPHGLVGGWLPWRLAMRRKLPCFDFNLFSLLVYWASVSLRCTRFVSVGWELVFSTHSLLSDLHAWGTQRKGQYICWGLQVPCGLLCRIELKVRDIHMSTCQHSSWRICARNRDLQR